MEQKENQFGSYLKERVEKINEASFHPKNFEELRNLKRDIIADAILNRKENTEHYLKFAERVRKERYFRMHHIDELDLPYDVLIFTSEKNIGKSRQMLAYMDEAYSRGEKFVIMRSLEIHLNTGLTQQFMEEHSKYNLASNCKIYHKEDKDPDNPKKTVECGLAMALSTCIKWKGGSFDGYKFIWFDEVTDEHKDIGINEFRKLFISVANSIERRKKDFKIIFTGNTDFSVSHPLFEFFEIDPSQNLVYTKRRAPGAERETRILYINSRGLYAEGAKGSRFIGAGGDPKAAMDAFMNSVKNNTERLVAMDLTYLADPYIALIFKDNQGEEWQLIVARYKWSETIDGITNISEKKHTWYYIKIEPFQPEYLCGYKIYTSDLTMHTLYRHYTIYKKDLINEWLFIRRIIRGGQVIFVKKETKLMLFKMLETMTKDAKVIVG